MKQLIVLLSLFSLILTASLALAEDRGNKSALWLKLKQKLEQMAPQKKTTTTAVGGVRGAKDQSADTLYWKDEAVKTTVDETEYKRFNDAYQLANDGKGAEAISQFESFLKDYPQSALRDDAQQALASLREAPPAAQ